MMSRDRVGRGVNFWSKLHDVIYERPLILTFQNGTLIRSGPSTMYSPTGTSDSSGFSERDSGTKKSYELSCFFIRLPPEFLPVSGPLTR